MYALLNPVTKTSISKLLAAAGITLVLASGAALAQDRDMAGRIGKLEQDIARLQRQVPGGRPNTAEAAAADAQAAQQDTDITVRILALERTVELLTGQIEETKFTAERTAKQVQVMQDDLSLRLARIEQSLGVLPAPAQQSQFVPMPPPTTSSSSSRPSIASALPQAEGAAPPAPASAFAPGAPMSAPVMQQPSTRPAPPPQQIQEAAAAVSSPGDVNSSGGFVIRTDAQGRPLRADPNAPQVPPPQAPMPSAQQSAPRAAPGPGPVTTGQVASVPAAAISLPDGTPKQQYDFAFEFLKRQDYPQAEATLRDFLKKHPKDPLAGNAQYWLGETYYVRGDFQQAAVEFMAGYQKYPKTNKGPDNLLKLGMSLSKLNQNDGACTALGRLAKDYPDAGDALLKSAKTERARLKCKA